MKILFVGNACGFLTIQLARKLQEAYPALEVDVFTDQVPVAPHPYGKVYAYKSGKGLWSLNYLKSIYQYLQMRKVLRQIPSEYDAIHVLLVVPTYRLFWRSLSAKGKVSVLTFFGSEYYRSNVLYRIFTKGMARTANRVTASNVQTLSDVCDHYDVPVSKRRLCRFGLTILEEIDQVTAAEITEFDRKHEIDSSTKCISVGYNAATIQNHELILDQIHVCQDELPPFVLFFQFHGHRHAYVQQVIEKANRLGLPFRIIDGLSDRELAVYRKRIDVCIQLQKTDQFSGAMQEHLYAGSRVITGNWLPYQVLDEKGTDYCKIQSIEELHKVLPHQIGMTSNSINKEIIASLSSWQLTISGWYELYAIS